MSLFLGVASIGLGLLGSKKSSDADKLMAQNYELQAKMAETQAMQQEVERGIQLRKQLSALGSSVSASGVAVGDYGSQWAIRREETELSKKDIKSIRLMGSATRSKYLISAQGAYTSASARRLSGLASAAGAAYSMFKK